LLGVETVRRRRNGSLVDVSLTLTAAKDVNGELLAYVAVVRDISERKALECARTDFMAMLTHDIKNPVGVVLGCADMLAESNLSSDDAESVCAIRHAAETIDRLVSDLLISAMIESGQLELQSERIPVRDLICAAVEQFRATASRQMICLEAEEITAAGFIDGDRRQLERALGNLINNAIKYTARGGRVSVGVSLCNGRILLRVCDNGPGIAAEEIPYLFDKYRRVRGNGEVEGVGLGLYIVRHLVEAHGGSIAVRSGVGRGSTFIISLPAADAGAGVQAYH
jgi:two-component system sensor histidine kinase ResE